jgi:hypothetical protein
MWSFSFAKYGDFAAVMMANEVARRHEHLFQVYSLSAGGDHEFVAADIESYVPPPEWLAFCESLALGSDVRARALAVQAIRPCAGAIGM